MPGITQLRSIFQWFDEYCFSNARQLGLKNKFSKTYELSDKSMKLQVCTWKQQMCPELAFDLDAEDKCLWLWSTDPVIGP